MSSMLMSQIIFIQAQDGGYFVVQGLNFRPNIIQGGRLIRCVPANANHNVQIFGRYFLVFASKLTHNMVLTAWNIAGIHLHSDFR